MAQEAPMNPVLILILTVIVLLLCFLLAQPVDAGGGVVLRPPFNGTYRVTAYFDHDKPNYSIGDDGYIWIYNGERVPASYPNQTGEPYPYDGHDGWDWSMGEWTDVLAAAAGTVVVSTGDNNWDVEPCYGRTIVIDHGNGYYTQYSHLRQTLVQVGNQVAAGQHIAESGESAGGNCDVLPHLHFSVRHGGYDEDIYHHAVDPFGWRGSQRDPLYGYNQKESSCLWAGVPGANISCADFIVEDEGAGWSQDPAPDDACSDSVNSWARCDRGNGFRYHWTYVYNPADFWAKWTSTLPHQGYYQIQAFIPAEYVKKPKTTNAEYEVHRLSGTTTVPINQNNVSDNWVSLGTFFLQSPTEYVQLDDYTGEASLSRSIAADSMKFSAGITHLPDAYAANGWTASTIIRNNSASTMLYAIDYYNQSGGLAAPSSTGALAGNKSAIRASPSGHDGSAVVVADQDVAVAVTLQRSSPAWSSGAYIGFDQLGTAGTKFHVPLLMRQLNTASGIGNSQITVQNASTANATVNVYLYGSGGWGDFTHTLSNIPVGALRTYDLSNLPSGWYGSASVESTGAKVAVIAYLFTGADGLQTYNALPAESVGRTWLVPLFTSRLSNGLSTPVTVQNVSGSTIPAGSVTLACTPDPGSSGLSPFSKSNTTAIPHNESYFFNPVTDLSIPANWYGSCRITASGNVVSFVQMRVVGTANTAAYEAINANGADRSASFPGVAARLADGFATAATIQNLNLSNPAHVTLRYFGAPLFANCTVSDNRGPFAFTIPADGSLIRNHRLPGTDGLPNGWCGSLSVTSSDLPIHGFIPLTNLNNPPGDSFKAHNAITRP